MGKSCVDGDDLIASAFVQQAIQADIAWIYAFYSSLLENDDFFRIPVTDVN